MKTGLIGVDLTNNITRLVCEKFDFNEFEMIEMNKTELYSLLESKDFKNLYISDPYKKDVIKYIDVLSENAKRIKAVDTIVNREGKLYGYNTDYSAFLSVINKHAISLKDKKLLILGNGDTCAAIKVAAQDLGAKEVVVVDKIESEGVIRYIDCFAQHLDSDILINTTPTTCTPISLSLFHQCEMLIDYCYTPILSKLGLEAQECKIKHILGIELFVTQSKQMIEILSEKKISEEMVDKVIQDVLLQQYNIVLIGMPSAGKTTIGKILQKRLNKVFVDMDEVIVQETKVSIPEIFAKSKEAGFRKIESMVALQLSQYNNSIIGTGGGTIKNQSNMEHLKLNGIIIFIDRDLDKLVSVDPNRPLSSSKEALKKLQDERRSLYQKYADAIVVNNTNIEECVNHIIDAYQSIAATAVRKSNDIQGGN